MSPEAGLISAALILVCGSYGLASFAIWLVLRTSR